MADKGKVRGWLRQRLRAKGMTWLWCYQTARAHDGKMVEHSVPLGLVSDIGETDADAWRIVGKQRLDEQYIAHQSTGKPTFAALAAAYIRDGLPFRTKDGRRKTKGTIETYQYHLTNHILPRWAEMVAEEIRPLEIRNWLYDLHDGEDYEWPTCSKIAGVMSLVFDFADCNELYAIRNPLNKVVIPASETDCKQVRIFNPQQTMMLIESLAAPLQIAVLLVAATGVRVSECLGLMWKHVDWAAHRIWIQQAFRRGVLQTATKTRASRAPVPMCEVLAESLEKWREQSPYAGDADYIFASARREGRKPVWGQTLNAQYLKPAALKLRLIAKGERFGWHCFRHSLSTWANECTKDITVSQILLRHAKPETTAIYTHGDFDKALKAQRQYMAELTAAKSCTEVVQ